MADDAVVKVHLLDTEPVKKIIDALSTEKEDLQRVLDEAARELVAHIQENVRLLKELDKVKEQLLLVTHDRDRIVYARDEARRVAVELALGLSDSDAIVAPEDVTEIWHEAYMKAKGWSK